MKNYFKVLVKPKAAEKGRLSLDAFDPRNRPTRHIAFVVFDPKDRASVFVAWNEAKAVRHGAMRPYRGLLAEDVEIVLWRPVPFRGKWDEAPIVGVALLPVATDEEAAA